MYRINGPLFINKYRYKYRYVNGFCYRNKKVAINNITESLKLNRLSTRDLLGISRLKFGAASIDVLVIAIGPAANLFILPVVHYRIPMLVIGSILFFHVNRGSVIDDGCCVGPTTSSFFNFHFFPTHSTDRSGGVDAHPLERGDEGVEWRAIA